MSYLNKRKDQKLDLRLRSYSNIMFFVVSPRSHRLGATPKDKNLGHDEPYLTIP